MQKKWSNHWGCGCYTKRVCLLWTCALVLFILTCHVLSRSSVSHFKDLVTYNRVAGYVVQHILNGHSGPVPGIALVEGATPSVCLVSDLLFLCLCVCVFVQMSFSLPIMYSIHTTLAHSPSLSLSYLHLFIAVCGMGSDSVYMGPDRRKVRWMCNSPRPPFEPDSLATTAPNDTSAFAWLEDMLMWITFAVYELSRLLVKITWQPEIQLCSCCLLKVGTLISLSCVFVPVHWDADDSNP